MKLPARILIDGESLTALATAAGALFNHPFDLKIPKAVLASKQLLDKKLAKGYVVYGVNTNFGKDVSIIFRKPAQMVASQKNLVKSLLCGGSLSGESFATPITKGAMLSRINCLCKGYSAVRPCVIEKMAEAVELGLIPRVPPFGSVGASGDLIPSSYGANFIFGGFANKNLLCDTPRGPMPLNDAYQSFNYKPLRKIEPKECLSIVNSVSFCVSIASLVLFEFKKITDLTALVMAFASQAVKCFSEDFSPYIQELRSGAASGAVKFANKVFVLNSPNPLLLDADKCRAKPLKGISLQDAYSLGRCASQHLDPFLDIQDIIENKLNQILNSVHDNPVVDPFSNSIYSSGNFYAGDIASRMDWARVEIGRMTKLLHAVINRLVDENKNNGLNANLVFKQDGIQNGFKGLNLLETDFTTDLSGVVAISPLMVPTERDNQDIISLGMGASRKAYKEIDELENLLASSLTFALQAFDLRLKKEKIRLSEASFNPKLVEAYHIFRNIIPFLARDTSFHNINETFKSFIKNHGHEITV